MSIKYNKFGEVISVNGITTGQHLGTPMQDAIGTEEENSAYGVELGTITRVANCVDDKQPEVSGGTAIETCTVTIITEGLVLDPYTLYYTDKNLTPQSCTNEIESIEVAKNTMICCQDGYLLEDENITVIVGEDIMGETIVCRVGYVLGNTTIIFSS